MTKWMRSDTNRMLMAMRLNGTIVGHQGRLLNPLLRGWKDWVEWMSFMSIKSKQNFDLSLENLSFQQVPPNVGFPSTYCIQVWWTCNNKKILLSLNDKVNLAKLRQQNKILQGRSYFWFHPPTLVLQIFHPDVVGYFFNTGVYNILLQMPIASLNCHGN